MNDTIAVFVAESVDYADFYERRFDGFAAVEVLKLRQTTADYRLTMTMELLARAVEEAVVGSFNILHVSAHGNDDGIFLTDGRWLDWPAFAAIVKPFAGHGRSLVMSSCQGGHFGLTKALIKTGAAFDYVFGSTAETVYFTESCLAWSILYNRLADFGLNPRELRRTLDIMNTAVDGDFVYRRLDGSIHRRYPPLPS